MLSSLLYLLLNGYRKLAAEKLDSKKIIHKGACCFSCQSKKPI